MSESADNDSAMPRVDLPENPPPRISPNSSMKAENGAVKVNVSGPLNQVVDSMTRLRPTDTSGVVKKYMGGIKYLADLCNTADSVGYIIEIQRTGPATYDGQMLPVGVVDRIPVMTYNEVYDRVKELHGGGSYRLRVLDEEGTCKNMLQFNIDCLSVPPKIKVEGQGFVTPSRSTPNIFNTNLHRPMPLTQAAGAEDEIQNIRAKERLVAAEVTLKQREREAQQMQRRWKDEEDQDRERKEKIALAPMLQQQSQVQTLEQRMMQMQQAADQRMMQLIQANQAQMNSLMTSMMQKPQDNSHIQMMIESSRQNAQMMQTLMQAMVAGTTQKQHESVEAAKIQADAQNKTMEMMMRLQGGGNQKFDKIVELMIAQMFNKKDDSVQQAIHLMELGRKQTMEMLEMREEMGGKEELEYDPEVGVMGNIGKVIFGLLNGLMKGGGGMQGIAAVLQALGKHSPSEVQPTDLKNLAQVLEAQAARQGITQPLLPQLTANAQAQQNNPGQQQAVAAEGQFLRTPMNPLGTAPKPPPSFATQTVRPVQQTVQPQRQPQAVNQQVAQLEVYEEEEILVHSSNVIPISQAQPVAVQSDAVIEEKILSSVTEAMSMAIEDIKAQVKESEWPEFLSAKCPAVFLESLYRAPGPAERIELIQAKTSPATFAQLHAMLLDERQPKNYTNFMSALDALVSDYAQDQGYTMQQAASV